MLLGELRNGEIHAVSPGGSGCAPRLSGLAAEVALVICPILRAVNGRFGIQVAGACFFFALLAVKRLTEPALVLFARRELFFVWFHTRQRKPPRFGWEPLPCRVPISTGSQAPNATMMTVAHVSRGQHTEQAGKKLVTGGNFPSRSEAFYCWPDMRRHSRHAREPSVLLPAPAP